MLMTLREFNKRSDNPHILSPQSLWSLIVSPVLYEQLCPRRSEGRRAEPTEAPVWSCAGHRAGKGSQERVIQDAGGQETEREQGRRCSWKPAVREAFP